MDENGTEMSGMAYIMKVLFYQKLFHPSQTSNLNWGTCKTETVHVQLDKWLVMFLSNKSMFVALGWDIWGDKLSPRFW